MVRLELVGGGRMGEALLAGLLEAGWAEPGECCVVERLAARREELIGRFPGVRVVDEVVPADGAVLAVKPGDVPVAGAALAAAGVGRVLSIAAGVSTQALERVLGAGVPVVRAMPNTPALVRCGAAAVAAGAAAAEEDLAWAESILGAVGVVVRVQESQLDAVTGLSGSGPAYVMLVAEALIEGGVLVGLPRDVATTLAVETLLGSARLLHATGEHPAALREAVTSPGGTTAAGLRQLEERAVRAAVLGAVEASARRARELGS
ncbi:MAG: pyrroline-5-carboxylate reductase [Acidimicrobiales bacterium]|jgi:pyrroline-5-carboxylate reductase|nr:pyrroline-5-carboxylate reductase [Acidimicrobiales bacterium]